MIWSILIATIARRKEQFEYLKTKLENQIFNLFRKILDVTCK